MRLSKHTVQSDWQISEKEKSFKKKLSCVRMRITHVYNTEHKHLLCHSVTVNTENIKKVYCRKNKVQSTSFYSKCMFFCCFFLFVSLFLTENLLWNQKAEPHPTRNSRYCIMGVSVICNTSGMPLFHSSTVMFIFYNAEGTQRAHRMCNSKKNHFKHCSNWFRHELNI